MKMRRSIPRKNKKITQNTIKYDVKYIKRKLLEHMKKKGRYYLRRETDVEKN